MFAEYAGQKSRVKVSHYRQPAPPRPSVLTGHHAIAERPRRAQASSSPKPCGTHGRSGATRLDDDEHSAMLIGVMAGSTCTGRLGRRSAHEEPHATPRADTQV
jgi:hypothetical protein